MTKFPKLIPLQSPEFEGGFKLVTQDKLVGCMVTMVNGEIIHVVKPQKDLTKNDK